MIGLDCEVSTYVDINLSKRNEIKEWQQEWQSDQQSIWDRQKEELEQHRKNGLSQLQTEPVAQTKAKTESGAIVIGNFVYVVLALPFVYPRYFVGLIAISVAIL